MAQAGPCRNRRLRIVQIVENLDIGGLERVTVDLAKSHLAAGHESAVFCLFHAGDLAGELTATGVPVVVFDKPRGLSLRTLFALARQLRRCRADVVHTHNSGIHHYGAAAAMMAGVPAVINTRHGLATSDGSYYRHRNYRLVMPVTDHVVCVSEHSRRYYIDQGIIRPSRSSVIVNGISLALYRDRQARPGARRPALRLGTVGRLEPVKDHGTLLAAFARLLRRVPEATLHIAGSGSLESTLRRAAGELGINRQLVLAGPVKDIPGFLNQLDIFVLSSRSEGLPLAILEAMAAGLPIVSTRVGGVPEVAPEHSVAWYSPAGDPEALAHQLEEAASSPTLQERGMTARRIAEERFDLETMRRSYENLMQTICARKR